MDFLLTLLKEELERELNSGVFEKYNVRLSVVGRWRTILKRRKDVIGLIDTIEKKTRNFKTHRLTVLLGYDGQEEMLEAVESLRKSKTSATGTALTNALWTGELPPVDLVIRTGGEPHWSAGFLMWHTANSQLYFPDVLWPEFDHKEFQKALADYGKRERRFGK